MENQGYKNEWSIDGGSLIWVEMIHKGDMKLIKSVIGMPFKDHFFTNHNQSISFYINSKTKEEISKISYEKYKNPEFIKNLMALSKEIEDKIKKITEEINKDLTNKINHELFDLLNKYFDAYAELAGVYRLTRDTFFYRIIQELEKQVPKPKKENITLLLNNDLDKISFKINQEIKDIAVSLKKVGKRRFDMHNIYLDAFIKSRKLFEEIGRRLNLTLLEAKNCTLNELKEFLINKKEIPSQELENRIKYFKFVYEEDDFEIITRQDKDEKQDSETKEIKGQTAHPGYAKGNVRIVKETLNGPLIDTINKFKEGEILVARTTSPDMIPAAKKAKAIVTDVGGLLCHAAIVSREFGIPCIVGTNTASRIFKDGDLVEVNADKGIVRKIKS
jgi:phosphoenolpyruvate synthase/pyruvate phosphate dikinase